jgi:hypothetical protein
MGNNDYINPNWQDLLRANGLDTFEALWSRNADVWHEAPNVRRGGWSGVVRLTLARPEGGEVGIFVKRQENHTYREWRRFALPAATFEREFVNLMHFQRLGIPTLEPLYFGKRRVDGNLRAILVTLELSGCDPLDAPRWNPLAQTKLQHRRSLIRQIAETIRRMHAQHWQHNCLYPKHLFAGEFAGNSEGRYDVRLIDLEKAKWRPFRNRIAMHDLCSLHRHADGWSRSDRLRLFLAYCQVPRLTPATRKLLRNILMRARGKNAGA